MLRSGGHAFVLGSGIAGLSLAEILSRNGWTITLVDSATDLGGDASRCTQNWLHTGWLYAGLPHASAMEGCARSLRLFGKTYDPVLPRHVVNVEVDEAGVRYPGSNEGWFTPDPMHYAFAMSTYDMSPIHKATWRPYLESVVLRRLRKLGYPTEPISDLPQGLIQLMRHWEGDDAGHTRYRVVASTDVRIDTRAVLGALLKMLGEKARVLTGTSCDVVRRGDRTALRIDGELHTPDLCVFAAGKSVPALLATLGADAVATRFKSISSPIVVLKRALDLPNFIRYTPNLPETVNHVRYAVGGSDVSTIGSYDYHPTDQRPDLGPFVEKVCRRLDVSADDVLGCYYGTKTELTGKMARRYNHAVDAVNENTFYAIAGKFSQFPLLVNEFANKLGLRVDIPNAERGTLDLEVAPTAPEHLVRSSGIQRKPHAA